MKKISLILAAVIFLGIVSVSLADTRQKPTVAVYTASTLIKRGDARLYRISFIATATNGNFAVYDALDGTTVAKIRTEGSQATANNSAVYDYGLQPIECSTGLYLWISGGSVVITYD